MKENTVEKYKMESVHRTDIHGAPYNPRTISEAAAQKLRKELKEIGLLAPIVVNRITMNVVSGHQRLDAMDAIMRTADYMVTVAMVELNEQEEIRANVLMNNTSVMGEWDTDKLSELKQMMPDLDFLDDLGFDQADIDVMFAGDEDFLTSFDTQEDEKTEAEKMASIDAFKAAKKSQKQKIKAKEAENGDTWAVAKDDNLVIVVFNTNKEKAEFMRRAKHPITERFVKPSVLYDIASGKINLYGKIEESGE